MTYKSAAQRVTGFYSPVKRAVKAAARVVKEVASDPLGMKRDKKRSEVFEKQAAEVKAEQLKERKKDYYKVK